MAEAAGCKSGMDNFYRFGLMLIKEQEKMALIVSQQADQCPGEQQPLIDSMVTFLTERKWHATSSYWSSDFSDVEEKFQKIWPHLVLVIDSLKPSRRKLCPSCLLCRTAPQCWESIENLIKTIKQLSDECGTAIFLLSNRSWSQHGIKDLHKAGVSKVMNLNDNSALDENLHWLATCQLPLQIRLRACAGIFAALESIDYPLQIIDANHVVQMVNKAYEDQHQINRSDLIGRLSSDAPRLGSLPEETEQNNEESIDERAIKFHSQRPKHHSLSDAHGSNFWKFFGVSRPANKLAQFISEKTNANHTSALKQPTNGCSTRQRSFSFAKEQTSVDTPVSEILTLLKELQRKCEDDSSVNEPIQKAVRILNSTDLYSPLITRFTREDKVSSDLFGGLVMNGLIPVRTRSRKTSLSEVMRAEKNLRHSNRLIRRASPEITAVLKLEEKWDFNIFELERLSLNRPLVHLGMKILQRWKVRDFLKCSEGCLMAWLDVVETHYHTKNAYHNSTHAADVLQAAAYYLGKEKVANSIGHIDAVATLLASIVHDVDHPGRGNAFLINSRHSLALLYNDVAVLENHHAALTFQLTVSDPCLNIFAQLSRQDFSVLRKSVVDLVLATDMNRHFEYLAKFQATMLCAENDNPNREENQEGIDTRRIICRILIKCADVSNPTRPWQQCKEWAYRICEEYFAQTAEERAKGLPLTMEVFDRETCNIPLTQCSFTDMFIKGMFRSWSEFCDMPEILALIEQNYVKWEEERKTWPAQRDPEMARVQRELSRRSSAVDNGSDPKVVDSTWSRLSLETTTLGPLVAYRQSLGAASQLGSDLVELL